MDAVLLALGRYPLKIMCKIPNIEKIENDYLIKKRLLLKDHCLPPGHFQRFWIGEKLSIYSYVYQHTSRCGDTENPIHSPYTAIYVECIPYVEALKAVPGASFIYGNKFLHPIQSTKVKVSFKPEDGQAQDRVIVELEGSAPVGVPDVWDEKARMSVLVEFDSTSFSFIHSYFTVQFLHYFTII